MSEKSPIASLNRPPSNALAPTAPLDLLHLVVERVAKQVRRHLAAVVELGLQMQPLPDLGAGDLGRRRVFHQIVERHGAAAAEPGFDILHADADVLAQALLGALALMNLEQIGARSRHVVAQPRS